MASVVSSRVSSVSSILKASGVRSMVKNKKISFKLPQNIKKILSNYEQGCDHQVYTEMICILRNANVKDVELVDLLKDLHECMPILGSMNKSKPHHDLLIEVLLNMEWTYKSPEIIEGFKKFIDDLMSIHSCYSSLIIDKLVLQFTLVEKDSKPWKDGICPESYNKRISHVHELLRKFLKIIPMSSNLLIQSLLLRYPHSSVGLLITEQYVYALFQILDYAPLLRKDILCLIVDRLLALDVQLPVNEIQEFEDENMETDDTIFQLDDAVVDSTTEKSDPHIIQHPDAEKLDVCMEQFFSYIYNYCHTKEQIDVDSLRNLYQELLYAFEDKILSTYASRHVQFIMFYFCSFKPTVSETFVRWLWQKVSNPNVAPVLRQSSVSYIASLLARASFIKVSLIKGVLAEMASWVHSYISSQDSLECANSDVRVHTVFYSVCQAMFYLLAFRHKDLIGDSIDEGNKNLLFLQGLNLNKIVTSKLNPLKYSQPAVVQNFAAVTRNYQLAYCYTVMERNSRSNLPVIQTSNRFMNWLDTFFPYDPYLLELSGKRVKNIYNNSQCTFNTTDSQISKEKVEHDENDFMDESFTSISYEKVFAYSTSPGFK